MPRKDDELEDVTDGLEWLLPKTLPYSCRGVVNLMQPALSKISYILQCWGNSDVYASYIDTLHHETQLPYTTYTRKTNIEYIVNQKVCNINIYIGISMNGRPCVQILPTYVAINT